jgi:hypothetical protein
VFSSLLVVRCNILLHVEKNFLTTPLIHCILMVFVWVDSTLTLSMRIERGRTVAASVESSSEERRIPVDVPGG